MAAPIVFSRASLIGLMLYSLAAPAQQTPPPAYQQAARVADVPATALFAVALQESGTSVRGRLVPWPWTLNIAGTSHRYRNSAQACSALRLALKQQPATRIDAGLGQLNVGYQGHRVEYPCQLLDPYRNLAIAATILREQYEAGGDWLIAIGRYHRPAGGTPAARYRRRVQQHLTRVLGLTSAEVTLRGATP